MAATAAAMEAPVTLSRALCRRRRGEFPAKIGLAMGVIIPTMPFKRFVIVRASDPRREHDKSDGAFTSQEDLGYLWKLGAGSILGAAAIKYGSVLFPTITRPNIVEAIIIISVPVVIAVLVLFVHSRVEQ